ncbi:MAG: hypothetical protein Q9159_003954 [Coniocarpon cinnabarinum]
MEQCKTSSLLLSGLCISFTSYLTQQAPFQKKHPELLHSLYLQKISSSVVQNLLLRRSPTHFGYKTSVTVYKIMASVSSMGADSDSSFNPYTQTVTLMTPSDGPVPIAITDIDDYVTYGVRVCINYASQIGASFILLICLLLTARPDKRTSAIFILNTLALFFNFIRSICQCVYFTGQFYEFYTYFSGDYSLVPQGQYGASVAAIVFTLVVLICAEGSLALQVRCLVNSPTVPAPQRRVITALGAIFVVVALGFRLALCIENSKAVMSAESFEYGIWLEKTSTYTIMASIIFFSVIFVGKLAVALRRRRNTLGLQNFGPTEIVFIMGCQTMIIPAIFAILQNFTEAPELGTQTLTLTVIFLPLSSLWAGAHIDNMQADKGPKLPVGASSESKLRKGRLALLLSRAKRDSSDIEEGGASPMNPFTETTGTRTSITSSSLGAQDTSKHKDVHSATA